MVSNIGVQFAFPMGKRVFRSRPSPYIYKKSLSNQIINICDNDDFYRQRFCRPFYCPLVMVFLWVFTDAFPSTTEDLFYRNENKNIHTES